MSEPLTSNEIEDVLSSIRRLVSDELRPAARAAAAPGPASALLLTPALRVVGEPSEPLAPPVAEPALAEETIAAPQADDVLSDPAENAATAHDPWEIAPPTQEYEEQIAGDAEFAPVADDAPPAGPVLASAAGADWDDGAEVLWSAPGLAEDHDLMDDAQDQAPAATQGHWSAQEVPEATWAQEEPDWAEPEPATFTAHPRKASLASDPLARAWADRAEAEVRAGLGATVTPPKVEAAHPTQEPLRAAGTPEPGIFDGTDPELDEEALRDIVRDIIREELAGTLGERITRNVRKLVRVEINRALTAREFE